MIHELADSRQVHGRSDERGKTRVKVNSGKIGHRFRRGPGYWHHSIPDVRVNNYPVRPILVGRHRPRTGPNSFIEFNEADEGSPFDDEGPRRKRDEDDDDDDENGHDNRWPDLPARRPKKRKSARPGFATFDKNCKNDLKIIIFTF